MTPISWMAVYNRVILTRLFSALPEAISLDLMCYSSIFLGTLAFPPPQQPSSGSISPLYSFGLPIVAYLMLRSLPNLSRGRSCCIGRCSDRCSAHAHFLLLTIHLSTVVLVSDFRVLFVCPRPPSDSQSCSFGCLRVASVHFVAELAPA